jgi:hypothetical protein
MIRKGQIRWLPKGDIVGQSLFISGLFGVAMVCLKGEQAPSPLTFQLRNTSLETMSSGNVI